MGQGYRETGALAKLARRVGGAGTLPRLVLMTDDERLPDPCAAARRLPRGSLVIVRSRTAKHRARLASDIARIARAQGLFLLVADDPSLAVRIGADGVHLPERHAGRLAHWRGRRPTWFFTASAHSFWAVARAARFGADAIFLSPVFPTKSHPGRPAITPIRFRQIARQTSIPLYPLGGIDARSARQLLGARIAGFAAIGALAG